MEITFRIFLLFSLLFSVVKSCSQCQAFNRRVANLSTCECGMCLPRFVEDVRDQSFCNKIVILHHPTSLTKASEGGTINLTGLFQGNADCIWMRLDESRVPLRYHHIDKSAKINLHQRYDSKQNTKLCTLSISYLSKPETGFYSLQSSKDEESAVRSNDAEVILLESTTAPAVENQVNSGAKMTMMSFTLPVLIFIVYTVLYSMFL